MGRRILLVSHPTRPDVAEITDDVARQLLAAGIDVVHAPESVDGPPAIDLTAAPGTPEAKESPAAGCELVCVLGGDGTILRGAAYSRIGDVPLLGINLGRVGFLAEVEREEVSTSVERIVARDYRVEERMTLDVLVTHEGRELARTWAFNEVSIEKAERERMLEVSIRVDRRPLSTYGCDGVIVATPTGSTAYAFSAGGPVMWPDVEAILLVPNSAHALFARPLVVAPDSHLAIDVLDHTEGHGVLWCDGRRRVGLPYGSCVEVQRGAHPVRLARLAQAPFTDRLVAKFHLSVDGWRGNGSSRHH